jgi:hypothetical protein
LTSIIWEQVFSSRTIFSKKWGIPENAPRALPALWWLHRNIKQNKPFLLYGIHEQISKINLTPISQSNTNALKPAFLLDFRAKCPLLELFFRFVASPVLHCFFLQIRIILMRFYLSFIWFQSWCTQIVPIPQIYNNHLCASIVKLANATCSSSCKLFAWSIANFIFSFSSVDNFHYPKNILIILSNDVPSYLFPSFFPIRYTLCSKLPFFKILIITTWSLSWSL